MGLKKIYFSLAIMPILCYIVIVKYRLALETKTYGLAGLISKALTLETCGAFFGEL